MLTIENVEDIVNQHSQRIYTPRIEGRWIVWNCVVSVQTMGKFVERVKEEGIPAFCRKGTFGVLASAVEEF